MKIRELKKEDVNVCAGLGALFHKESEYRVLTYDYKKTISFFESIITDDYRQMFVAEDNGKIVGGLAGEIIAPYFSDDTAAGDIFIYIMEEYRHGELGSLLAQEFIDWAISKGVKIVYFRDTSGIDTGKMKIFYNRLGFSQVGSIYRRVL